MNDHRRPRLVKVLAGFGLIATLGACSVTDDVVCLDSYCATNDEGRYIEALTFDPATYQIDPKTRADSLREVRAINKGIVQHDELRSYAQSVLDRIVKAGPAVGEPPIVLIAANASMNAKSLPGGVIVIHHYLFEILENEDQLAFVLAHEYAHYLLQHFSVFDEIRTYALSAVEAVVALHVREDDDARRRLLQVYGSDILIRDLIYPVWSRRTEDEADRLGLDLLVAAGYAPDGGQGYLRHVANYEEQVGRSAQIELNKLEIELQEQYGGETPDSSADPGTGKIDVTGILLKNGLEAFRDLQQDVAARHDEAIERAGSISVYGEREYDEAYFRTPDTSSWQRALSRAAPVLDSYRAATEVITTLEREKPSTKTLSLMEARARHAVTGATESDSYTRMAFYMVRFAQNQFSLAERNLDIALGNDPSPSFQLLEAKADLLEKQGDPKGAFNLLDKHAEQYDWPFSAYLSMIRLAPVVGEKDRRFELVTNCMFKYPQSQFACRSTR